MLQWNKIGIPHKGWEYLGIIDLFEDAYPNECAVYIQCEMCGKERIRYVHLLKHAEYDGVMRVGCICASKMTNDYVTPQEKEQSIKNRMNRRRNFMKREWKFKPETGSYILRYKGEYITIMRSKFGSGYGVIYRGEQRWKYQERKISDFFTAKIVAFELFEELYKSKRQLNSNLDEMKLLGFKINH
ncbi:MAG: hypothetical protein IJC05_00915 [Phascolarctobacterium sp.]|nr:hypothetical protein [Phascolarctobacterium sp.]